MKFLPGFRFLPVRISVGGFRERADVGVATALSSLKQLLCGQNAGRMAQAPAKLFGSATLKVETTPVIDPELQHTRRPVQTFMSPEATHALGNISVGADQIQ
jgi:hypothetical protein